jgi:bacterioferritin-associated ferredoxin
MVLCHCRVRRDADIVEAARTCGSTDPAVVAERAGAGDGCGDCLEAIESLLCRMRESLAPAV